MSPLLAITHREAAPCFLCLLACVSCLHAGTLATTRAPSSRARAVHCAAPPIPLCCRPVLDAWDRTARFAEQRTELKRLHVLKVKQALPSGRRRRFPVFAPCSPRFHPLFTLCSVRVHPVLTPCSPLVHPVFYLFCTLCSPRVHPPPPHPCVLTPICISTPLCRCARRLTCERPWRSATPPSHASAHGSTRSSDGSGAAQRSLSLSCLSFVCTCVLQVLFSFNCFVDFQTHF